MSVLNKNLIKFIKILSVCYIIILFISNNINSSFAELREIENDWLCDSFAEEGGCILKDKDVCYGVGLKKNINGYFGSKALCLGSLKGKFIFMKDKNFFTLPCMIGSVFIDGNNVHILGNEKFYPYLLFKEFSEPLGIAIAKENLKILGGVYFNDYLYGDGLILHKKDWGFSYAHFYTDDCYTIGEKSMRCFCASKIRYGYNEFEKAIMELITENDLYNHDYYDSSCRGACRDGRLYNWCYGLLKCRSSDRIIKVEQKISRSGEKCEYAEFLSGSCVKQGVGNILKNERFLEKIKKEYLILSEYPSEIIQNRGMFLCKKKDYFSVSGITKFGSDLEYEISSKKYSGNLYLDSMLDIVAMKYSENPDYYEIEKRYSKDSALIKRGSEKYLISNNIARKIIKTISKKDLYKYNSYVDGLHKDVNSLLKDKNNGIINATFLLKNKTCYSSSSCRKKQKEKCLVDVDVETIDYDFKTNEAIKVCAKWGIDFDYNNFKNSTFKCMKYITVTKDSPVFKSAEKQVTKDCKSKCIATPGKTDIGLHVNVNTKNVKT